jgi:hypothetical protein
MGRDTFSLAAYNQTMSGAHQAGSHTYRGEERQRSGLGLDPLVDPAGNGLIRRSLARKDKLESGQWEMTIGTPMLVETLLDTTGSMGHNVRIALDVLPLTYDLLKESVRAVLGRYDLQMITAIFGDVRDRYILNRSHAEMGGKIAEQMTMLLPEGGGAGNGKEDPQYGLFAAAYLTAAETNGYDLKTYHFSISDEPLYPNYDIATLHRVFGETVFEKVKENGHSIVETELPDVVQVVNRAHIFFLMVGDRKDVYRQWSELYGEDRVVMLPNVSLLPQVQAAIIGLTEGVIDLQSIEAFLLESGVSAANAKLIARSVSRIPIGAQALLPNFDKIPKAGDVFAEKTDLWPVAEGSVKKEPAEAEAEGWL